ncbi:MAG: hypothetical protein ACLPX5_01980 [Dissulfurispiraceae bacterium]
MEGDYIHPECREKMTALARYIWKTPRIRRSAICAVIGLLSSSGILLLESASTHVYASSLVDESKCDFQKGPCAKNIAYLEVTLDITPKPVKAMEELFFSIVIKGGPTDESLVLYLAMPGMYMGGNEVILKKASDGRYIGKGIIPRCSTGKRLWSATVDVPLKGKAEFLFDVIY